ncbi:MAG: DMT family transporter [Planctomycetota bacterium]
MSLVRQVKPGSGLMVASAFFFSFMAFGVRALGKTMPGLPILEIVMFRAMTVFLCSLVAMRICRISWKGRSSVLLWRSLGAFAGMTTYYICLQELPLGVGVMLQQLNPAFATLLGYLFLREVMRWRHVLCLCGAFGGVMLISWAPSVGHGDWSLYGVFMGMLSALIAGAAYVLIRHMIRQEPALRIVAWTPMVSLMSSCLVFGLPELGFDWGGPSYVAPVGSQWWLLLLVGLSTFGGQLTLTSGIKLLPAGEATTIAMVQVPMALLLDVLAFSDLPSAKAVGGIVLVLVSVIALVRQPR